MAILLISSFEDSNIFHAFSLEIKAIWDIVAADKKGKYILLLKNYVTGEPAHEWRKDLLASILPVYISRDDIKEDIDRICDVNVSEWMVDPWKFQKYAPSAHYLALAKEVKEANKANNKTGKYLLYLKRKKSRKLFDHNSLMDFDFVFSDWCTSQQLPYKIACFDEATFQEQVETVSEAKVMISCHGAANTNIFLLPDDGHLLEFNFRKHWYCDPVCDDHFTGTLSYKTRCNGKLNYRPYFHKADFHNMCTLFDKGYSELDIENADTYLSRNPIDIMNVYVDFEKVTPKLLNLFAK